METANDENLIAVLMEALLSNEVKKIFFEDFSGRLSLERILPC